MNSLVGRLLLLVTIAVLPALAGEIWSALQARETRAHAIEDDARRLVQLVATDQAQMMAATRQALTVLGIIRSAQGAGDRCNTFYADLLFTMPGYQTAQAARLDGRIDCTHAPVGGEGDVTTTDWFQQALARGFAVSRSPGAAEAGEGLIFAAPWRDQTGRVGGVVAASIGLDWLKARLESLPLPPGAAAVLIGSDGSILVGRLDPAMRRAWQAHGPIRPVSQAEGISLRTFDGPRGSTYLVGISALGRQSGDLQVAIAFDRDRAFAAAARAGQRDVTLLILGLGLALAVAASGTLHLVRRPVGRLLDAAAAWRSGALSTRTGLAAGASEFRRLAIAFDDMAAALEGRERALRIALESTTDSVFVLDHDWHFSFLNARAAEQLGGGDLLGRNLWEIFPKAAETPLWSTFHDAVAHRRPGHVELLEPTLQRRLDLYAYPSAEGLTVFFRDVTEQRRIEALAAEHDSRLRAIAEAIPSLLFVSDPDGRNVFVNRRFQEFTGLPPSRLLGDAWADLLHPAEAARVEAVWRESMAAGRPYEMEIRIRAADGSWRWFLLRGAPLHLPDGRIENWYGVCTEIDELIAAREAMARQGEMLERLVAERTAELRTREAQLAQAQKMEAVGQLTGGVAHDFNNLLQAVSGNLELALSALTRDEVGRVRRLLGNAARAIGRGARLTSQLLAFSRRQVLRSERVEPRRLLADMADLVRRAAGETVVVRTEVEPGLWCCRADPAQLEAAVLNLVINARDAMPDGGELVIALANAPLDAEAAGGLDVVPGDYVRVEVADNGMGMPAEVLQRACEPFFTTKEVGRGSGLGLAQVHGFLRQSGGALRITSVAGTGTTVSMFFPRDTAMAEVAVAPRVASVAVRPGRGAQVLLVEDDQEVLDALQFALIDAGFQVVPARDGADALSVLQSGRHLDVVLSDVVLPGGVSGVDVAREARRLQPELPVLLTSGHAGDVLARCGAELEFEVIPKPCPQAELLSRVATAAATRLQAAVG
ncbi:Histidine kinase [Rhodovastum atsumiense]|uniref:histidine kinase n=1 Tax=Rhodovastum atsumiense TaxID=504468 RepID=A0A5M6INS6_9PROT|nr:PAS domain-containing protein [Rhodovastum atsumiense]KAA5609923.1 PAS domain-containing protein [Rhodovastum atsumiense]CAH2604540.1 Histidine kinase [Rhodovastum atsumiense]